MRKNKEFLLLTFLIACVMINLFNMPTIISDISSKSQNEKLNQNDNNQEINVPDNLKEPKPANPSSELHNFSFKAYVKEAWNQTYYFSELNSTKPDNSQTEWFTLPNTNNASIFFHFVMLDLTNTTSSPMELVYPSNFTIMKLSYLNESLEQDVISVINDLGTEIGKGIVWGQTVRINETSDAKFVVWNDWAENTNISYTAYMPTDAKRNYTIEQRFIPTPENTDVDILTWELDIDRHYSPITSNQFYNGSVRIDELDKFTLENVLGYDGSYWHKLNYTRKDDTFYFNESYQNYKIELQMPNYVSAVYNDNLTWIDNKNELNLYTTCKMAGNLTITLKDTNGTIFEKNKDNVVKDEVVYFNYIMEKNATAGIGYLNITLVNGSKIYFGVKVAEITFYKRSFIIGFTDNTTAFEPNFYVGAIYLDRDYVEYLETIGYSLGNPAQINYIVNKTIIPNATVTYELTDYIGEVPFIIEPNIHIPLYLTTIDLRELQIPPQETNITFTARQSYYESSVFIVEPFIIYKRNATVEIFVTADKLEVGQEFTLTVNLKVNYTYESGFVYLIENYLRIPAIVNLTFINNATGEIDGPHPWGQEIVQSFTLFDEEGNLPKITNDTIPGFYKINITIDSEYYQGSDEYLVEIIKKPLTISLNYDSKVDEEEDFDITWELENGNWNRENMTLEIYVDGIHYSTVNLTKIEGFSGITALELDKGDHVITYRLISPFYEAERVITIEAEKDKSEPKEKSWLEENWLFLLLLILAIITMSIFGIYMTFSRRRVKAQRELDSELVALKTRLAATEDNISLIQTQISEIAGIYWILVIHSEQGTTMVEITEFRFNEVLGEEFKVFVEEGMIRDSALIGGFLTAIRNFSRETAGESHEYQPIFNSQTDYSTIANDKEVHRRILEGSSYFMAFISARGTMEISEVLSAVNSKFHDGYGEAAKEFLGKVTVFNPFKEEVATLLQNEIIELQKKLEDGILLRQHYERHLKQVQEKIGIKKIK